MKNWGSLEAFFAELNKNVTYVVLRNYETLSTDITDSKHPDIDILCENTDALVRAACSERRGKKADNPAHQKIQIREKKISMDVREVGDGYYDPAWERELLNNRIFLNGYYVLSKEDYFYSLLYHVLIQKEVISEDYQQRLLNMAAECGIEDYGSDRITCLENYMRKKGYRFTYPASNTRFFIEKVNDKNLIEKNPLKKAKRIMWAVSHKK